MNFEKMWAKADQASLTFGTAKPFPHVVIDGFLDDPEEAIKAFPSFVPGFWTESKNRHTENKLVSKGRAPKWELFNDSAKRLFADLFSEPFLLCLKHITGLLLVPDPYFVEGGFHAIKRGGRLSAHADFSHHPKLGLERRLNLLLYLNKDWKEEWGGHLGLYGEDRNVPEVKILPVMNRCVIFETSDRSYHGHPDPLECPEGVYRKSLALYYYSLPRPERENRKIFFPGDPSFKA